MLKAGKISDFEENNNSYFHILLNFDLIFWHIRILNFQFQSNLNNDLKGEQ